MGSPVGVGTAATGANDGRMPAFAGCTTVAGALVVGAAGTGATDGLMPPVAGCATGFVLVLDFGAAVAADFIPRVAGASPARAKNAPTPTGRFLRLERRLRCDSTRTGGTSKL